MEIFLLHENTTLSVAVYKRQYLTECVSPLRSGYWLFVAYARGLSNHRSHDSAGVAFYKSVFVLQCWPYNDAKTCVIDLSII
jgi:hypothetical protein